ncbi:carboxypeptidase M-like [Dermacentor variabilis]|uniref:carboxypeptidase M-like n=1 Tax=Dermacentor variabilis TaxID=34621 RepID=UPI003F5BA71E
MKRENSNGVAINRNFPSAFERVAPSSRAPVEPESASVLRLMRAHPALLTVLLFAGLHGVLYPYDDQPGADLPWVRTGSTTPDDDVFQELSRSMVSLMALNGTAPCAGKPPVGANNEGFANETFEDGRSIYERSKATMRDAGMSLTKWKTKNQQLQNIFDSQEEQVEGASFSRISGSLADYAYAYEGSLPLSVFIGCCKYDEPRFLKGHFEQTRGPLLKLLRMADRGVRGTITNRRGEPVAGALLAISNRTVGFRSNQFGEFWRMLLPGFYMLLVLREADHNEIKEHRRDDRALRGADAAYVPVF